MTEHPAYVEHAPAIRAAIGEAPYVVLDGREMHPRTWAAPAPYVGKPFVYVWQGFQDAAGRWVTGEALLMHHPEMPEEMRDWPDVWHYRSLPEYVEPEEGEDRLRGYAVRQDYPPPEEH